MSLRRKSRRSARSEGSWAARYRVRNGEQGKTLYKGGGLFSITLRILGIISLHAERVTPLILEAFIVWLYREKNKEGFLKAFTEQPEYITNSMPPLKNIVKELQLRNAHICPRPLFAHLDNFIAILFNVNSDDEPFVCRHICHALILLLAARPENLMPKMQEKNDNVAFGACNPPPSTHFDLHTEEIVGTHHQRAWLGTAHAPAASPPTSLTGTPTRGTRSIRITRIHTTTMLRVSRTFGLMSLDPNVLTSLAPDGVRSSFQTSYGTAGIRI
ncbi:hypothetical protein C8R44DRAFT_886045 [Mycena epipterygia]|nr:hypothetical protein C8R44DRAFT_886045 [Mycena epipterygia]